MVLSLLKELDRRVGTMLEVHPADLRPMFSGCEMATVIRECRPVFAKLMENPDFTVGLLAYNFGNDTAFTTNLNTLLALHTTLTNVCNLLRDRDAIPLVDLTLQTVTGKTHIFRDTQFELRYISDKKSYQVLVNDVLAEEANAEAKLRDYAAATVCSNVRPKNRPSCQLMFRHVIFDHCAPWLDLQDRQIVFKFDRVKYAALISRFESFITMIWPTVEVFDKTDTMIAHASI